MNPLIQLKKATPGFLVALACFGLLPTTQAVSPAPDGCYPNYTTAEGCNALQFLAGGFGNTGVGWYSLYLAGDSNFNTGVGGGALALNNGDSNTAVGAAALLLNTTGTLNTAVGTDALVHNDIGSYNNAVGAFALFNNTTGYENTADGWAALENNTTGSFNTAVGDDALFDNTIGVGNTANGADALLSNTEGNANTAYGVDALQNNAAGDGNTAVGLAALSSNTTGDSNTAFGANAGFNVITADNVICIGTSGANVSNSCYIGQIFGVTSSGGTAVFINSDGRLGTTTSSRRFKHDISPMDSSSEELFALRPVTFCYNEEIDPAGTSQFGLVAEDVEKVNPDLVVRDEKGKPYSVRYDQVNAMLLNEFLKEHRKVDEQQATITELKSTVAQQQKDFQATAARQEKQIEALIAGLHRVSAQLEVNKPGPQVVNNP